MDTTDGPIGCIHPVRTIYAEFFEAHLFAGGTAYGFDRLHAAASAVLLRIGWRRVPVTGRA